MLWRVLGNFVGIRVDQDQSSKTQRNTSIVVPDASDDYRRSVSVGCGSVLYR